MTATVDLASRKHNATPLPFTIAIILCVPKHCVYISVVVILVVCASECDPLLLAVGAGLRRGRGAGRGVTAQN